MMEYNQIVADKILLLCEKNNLTVGQLAARCHTNKATIDKILQGKCKKPRIQTLMKIAGAFDMTLVQFIDQPELCPDDGDSDEPEELDQPEEPDETEQN